VIIEHKLCLGDEKTIEQIRENPYLQYFVGFTTFHKEQAIRYPTDLSLLNEARRPG
jgi:hypothetical protein